MALLQGANIYAIRRDGYRFAPPIYGLRQGVPKMLTKAEPCVFVVFGATGDLMRRKLLPALYQLADRKLCPKPCRILGVARDQALTDSVFRKWGQEALSLIHI